MTFLVTSIAATKELLISESFDCYDAFGHGAFQKRLMLLCALGAFLANSHALAFSLISRGVDYRCKQPLPYSNISAAASEELAEQLGRCLVYEDPAEPNNSRTVACREWQYDDEHARTTVVSAWNLVCQRKLLVLGMSVVQNAGSAMFVLVAGYVADKIGRAPVLVAAALVLMVSASASCFSSDYTTYAVLKFFTAGSSTLTMIFSAISLFEVTTHDNRPLHIAVSCTLGLLACDAWYFFMLQWSLRWEIALAVFILPATILLPAYLTVHESPRWLVATGQYERAEGVVLAAADANHFPLPSAACLLDRLRANMTRTANRRATIVEALLSGFSIRRRALIMCGSFFSNTFALYVAVYTKEQLSTPWQPYSAFFFNFTGYAIMHLLIRKFTMLTVTVTLFAVLCVVQCLLILNFAAGESAVIVEALTEVLIAFYYTGTVICSVYVLELFPTGLRATAMGWTFAFGRLGGVCALLSLVLKNIGRENLALVAAEFFLFVSLLMLRSLPPVTSVECTKMTSRRTSVQTMLNIERMKNTLEKGRAALSAAAGSTKGKNSSESSKTASTSRSSRSRRAKAKK
ncbi:solute carrier family 22 member 13-like [Dermacentor variabilis]|uniref:solute carrier family 22 member 13-like n=1 Tax=Dermacentor variabilis TaxID=34621 RepID=UPI003F5C817E